MRTAKQAMCVSRLTEVCCSDPLVVCAHSQLTLPCLVCVQEPGLQGSGAANSTRAELCRRAAGQLHPLHTARLAGSHEWACCCVLAVCRSSGGLSTEPLMRSRTGACRRCCWCAGEQCAVARSSPTPDTRRTLTSAVRNGPVKKAPAAGLRMWPLAGPHTCNLCRPPRRNSTDTAYFQRLRPYPRVLLRRCNTQFKDYDKCPIGCECWLGAEAWGLCCEAVVAASDATLLRMLRLQRAPVDT